MTEKLTDVTVLKNLKIYVTEGIQINSMLRDAFLEKDNTMGVLKHQGSIDTCRDIERILNGGKVMTVAEIQAAIKKAEKYKQGDYAQ